VNKYQHLKKIDGSIRPNNIADVNKDHWGGESIANKRQVLPVILATERIDLFVINIKVASLSSENPLTGKVTFFLHPSYVPDRVTVFAENNVAQLNGLHAIGPFTIAFRATTTPLNSNLTFSKFRLLLGSGDDHIELLL
jgi:hypothetical protein